MTNRYTTITSRITVLLEKDAIFSEYATHIEIADESGGPFLQIYQIGDRSKRVHDHQINIDIDQWPTLRAAIDSAVEVAKRLEQ